MDNLIYNKKFKNWIKNKKWKLFKYQVDFFESLHEKKNKQYLISSEVGTGKTITAFFPFFNYYSDNNKKKVLYISPLRSINSVLERNLFKISNELELNCSIQSRTSDVSHSIKNKQLLNIPDILLTTPESFALMIANPDASSMIESIDFLIIDELAELISNKRGDLLSLSLSRINTLNRKFILIGLSATLTNFSYVKKWLSFKGKTKLIKNDAKKEIKIHVLFDNKIPISGHNPNNCLNLIKRKLTNKKTIIFVNTRAQCELLFKDLFLISDKLILGIHHGSLSKKHRFKTEKLFSENKIDAIVSTSSLELGVDWKNVDQIINVGTPKNINRLVQRTGRSNHNYFGVPVSYLIPTNKFEYLECISAKQLAEKMNYEKIRERIGSKDVLCQHLLLLACNKGFRELDSFNEIKKALGYKNLEYSEFKEIISFVKDGGYLLNNYKKWSKLYLTESGYYKINNFKNRIKTLMNVGTIIDSANVEINLKNKKILGYVDQSFVNTVKKGSTFIFSGMCLEAISITSEKIIVKVVNKNVLNTPIYWGGSLPISSNLSEQILVNISESKKFPLEINQFINDQKKESTLPNKKNLLVETFPFKNGIYICIHSFLGRESNHTLSLLIVDFLKNFKIFSTDYSVNEYTLGIFIKCKQFNNQYILEFFESNYEKIDYLSTFIAKKTFKEICLITGLLDKKKYHTKNLVNSDIIFDTLKKYEPNHILIKITLEEVKRYFIEKGQLEILLNKNIVLKNLKKPSPFSKTLIFEKEKIKSHVADKDKILDLIKNEYELY